MPSKKYTPYIYETHPSDSITVIDGDTIKLDVRLLSRQMHVDIPKHDLGFGSKINPYLVDVAKDLSADNDILHPLTQEWSMRLSGIDTPEKNTAAGKLVTEVTKRWLRLHPGFTIASLKLDKFSGRFIGYPLPKVVAIPDDIGPKLHQQPPESLSRFLHEHKLAKPYNGRKKDPWTTEELNRVEGWAKNVIEVMRI